MSRIHVVRPGAIAAVCVLVFALPVLAQPASTPKVLRRTDTGEKAAIMRLADAEAAAPQGYSVVLVLGDMQTAGATDGNVPAAARKALTDMKDFLPYKSYRLLDAQWILGSQKTMTRLRGPNDQDYDLTLRGDMMMGKLRVSFRLQDPGVVGDASPRAAEVAAAQAAKLQDLQVARSVAEKEAAQMRERGASQQNVAAADQQMARIRHEIEAMKQISLPGSSAIIDTSFAMDVGETVVVGTSRVRGGDKALIALLTAVPKGTGTKKDD